MDRERRGAIAIPPARQRTAFAYCSANVNSGDVVKISGSPPKVSAAADGDSVYGVVLTEAETGGRALILIEGETTVRAKSTASWTTHWRVVAAGSHQVDQGSADDPHFATLLSHDATNNWARIYVHGDAMPRAARSLVDSSDVSWPLGALTAGRPLVLGTSSRVASPLHVGSTANRPASPFTGQLFWDSDIADLIVYDGTRWRSAAPHEFWCGRVNAFASTAMDMFFIAGNAMSDATAPFLMRQDGRFIGAYFSLKGGTGGKSWTLRLRLNGSGADTWAGSARTSSTSWQSFVETIDVAITAGSTVRWLCDQGGAAETLQVQVGTSFVYT